MDYKQTGTDYIKYVHVKTKHTNGIRPKNRKKKKKKGIYHNDGLELTMYQKVRRI